MEVFQSEISVTKANFFNVVTKMLSDNITWCSAPTIDTYTDSGATAVFYLTENIYFKVYGSNSNYTFDVYNYDTKCMTVISRSDNYFNFRIYKQNSCYALCFRANGNVISSYPFDTAVIIDTTDKGDDISVINNAYCVCDGSTTSYYACHKAYNIASTSSTVTQIVPLINSVSGKKFDNIHQILFTQTNKQFVLLNDEKWLFTDYFVIPCGDNITYKTYLTNEVTS